MIRIDLRDRDGPVTDFLRDSFSHFTASHSERISAIVVSASGFHGWIGVHFDTKANSDKFLKSFAEKHRDLHRMLAKEGEATDDWYGEDDGGRFCKNGEDFAFHGQREFRLPDYPDFYTVDPDEPVRFIDLNGKTILIDREKGDEAFNRVIFRFLKKALQSIEPFEGMHLESFARAGVEMHDSSFVEFWPIRQERRTRRSS